MIGFLKFLFGPPPQRENPPKTPRELKMFGALESLAKNTEEMTYKDLSNVTEHLFGACPITEEEFNQVRKIKEPKDGDILPPAWFRMFGGNTIDTPMRISNVVKTDTKVTFNFEPVEELS